MVRRIHEGARPATAHLSDPELVEMADSLFRGARIRGLSIVLNRVGEEETAEFLRRALEEEGLEPTCSIGAHPEIGKAWLLGEQLQAPEALEETALLMERVEEDLAATLGRSSPVSTSSS